MGNFNVRDYQNLDEVKELFKEYSQIKGAEGCFVSFDKELADLENFYGGGAILVGYEAEKPVACIAIKKKDDENCEVVTDTEE